MKSVRKWLITGIVLATAWLFLALDALPKGLLYWAVGCRPAQAQVRVQGQRVYDLELQAAFALADDMRKRDMQFSDLNERGQALMRRLQNDLRKDGYASYDDYVAGRRRWTVRLAEWLQGWLWSLHSAPYDRLAESRLHVVERYLRAALLVWGSVGAIYLVTHGLPNRRL